MSPNRRIALNVIATYGRSLYAMACGLFSSRWALMSLGQIDYGLYGVVGGLTAFLCFLNELMAGSVGRFYAYSIGESKKDNNDGVGLENCRKWFNIALTIHFVLPLMLVAVGYPVGEYVVCHYLTIPADRVAACVWVWRFTCISAFVSMCSVPFRAMYTAKQEIAELTVYSVAATTANVAMLYYMISHPGDWLTRYALGMCAIAVVPQLIIDMRALFVYQECKILPRYFWDMDRFKELLVFAGARAVALFSQILNGQGVAIVVNKFLGAAKNATVTIGNTINNQCSTFAGSFIGALYPAIVNAVGEGREEYARKLTNYTCALATIAFMIFMLPLMIEMDGVVRLWLKEPPEGVVTLGRLLLVAFVFERLTDGCWMLITAYGRRMVSYQISESAANLSSIVVVIALLCCGMGVASVGIGVIVSRIFAAGVKIAFARMCCGFPVGEWLRKVFLPLAFVSVPALAIGMGVPFLFKFSLWRVIMTTGVVELVFLPLVWMLLFGSEEKKMIKQKLSGRLAFLRQLRGHG